MERNTPQWVRQRLRASELSGAIAGAYASADLSGDNARLPDATLETPEYRVVLTTALLVGGTATAAITQKRGGVWVTSTVTITVEDPVGTMRGDPGAVGLVRWNRQAEAWLLWQLSCMVG